MTVDYLHDPVGAGSFRPCPTVSVTALAATVDDLADAVADEVQRVGKGPVLCAGVSLGGAVRLTLPLRHPSLVARAATVASAAQLGDPAAWHDRAGQVRAQSTSRMISGSARRNGLSIDEIREVILQSAVYSGVPAADTAFRIAGEVFGSEE